MTVFHHGREFVGEMTVAQQAQRQPSLASYERIEQDFERMHRGEAAARQFSTRRAAVNAQPLPFRADGKLAVCPDHHPPHAERGLRRYSAGDVSIRLTLRGPESLSA